MNKSPRTSTFILRLMHGAGGDGSGMNVSGVIERVRTGAKHPFESREALCRLLQTLITDDHQGEQP